VSIHVFAGPTLAGQDVLGILPGAVVHPPVAHGDLLRLGLSRGDIVVIVDGYYHQSASVRHKEILALLATGVVVVGCASMGALRAAELSEYGMIGNGAVYRMYREGVLDADDEVAVAHGPEPDYRSFTVPSVVIRYAAGLAVATGVIDELNAASIVAAARGVHYTERSWQAVARVVAPAESTAAALARLRKFVEAHPETTNIKALDALDTLRKIANGELHGDQRLIDSWTSGHWRNRFLGEWQAEFGISKVGEIEVSHSALIRYQQLYLDDFPARWERFALGRITGAGPEANELAVLARSTATRSGLIVDAKTVSRFRRWLTEEETAKLSATDAIVRVLVRSYRPPYPTRDLVEDQPGLVTDELAMRAVAEANVVNSEVASWGGKNTVGHIKLAPLRMHLRQIWRINDTDPAVLLAAARDRGFSTTQQAIDAARMFFLHKSFLGKAG
jgi:hypothetical protein